MATAVFYPMHESQSGYALGNGAYVENPGNYEIADATYSLIRFSGIDIPKGSWVNSARVEQTITAKSDTTAGNVTWIAMYHNTGVSQVLNVGVNEISTRSNTLHAQSTFHWNNSGQWSAQNLSMDVTGALRNVLALPDWNRWHSYTHINIWMNPSSGQVFYAHGGPFSSQAYPRLIVDYTPAAVNESTMAVNLAENSIVSNGLRHMKFNTLFKFKQPAYAVQASPPAGGPGGNAVYVKTLEVGPTALTWESYLNLVPGRWYTFSAYVYCYGDLPGNLKISAPLHGSVNNGTTSVKNAWVRIHTHYQHTAGATPVFAIETPDNSPAQKIFFAAGISLTEGKFLRPLFNGNTSPAGTTRRWASSSGMSIITGTAPSGAFTANPDASWKRAKEVNWTSSSQSGVHIEWPGGDHHYYGTAKTIKLTNNISIGTKTLSGTIIGANGLAAPMANGTLKVFPTTTFVKQSDGSWKAAPVWAGTTRRQLKVIGHDD